MSRIKPVGWLLDNPWYAVIAVILAVFTWWAIGTRKSDHYVRAAFPSAFNLVSGQDVQIDGLDAGKIKKVEYRDGQALVEVGVNDEYWPLRAGTTIKSRWGTSIGSGTRRLDVEPGPESARAIPEGGVIGTKDTTAAVDVDEVLNTFSEDTREDTKALTRKLDEALRGSERQLNRGLRSSAPAVRSAGDVLGDLGRDTAALRGLVVNGRRLTGTLAARQSEVSDLVTVAARTFQAFATNSTGVQQSIEALPSTLDDARTTLARLDGSVDTLDALAADLKPGAARLAPLARSATPALRELRHVVPTALSTLRTTTRSAPDVERLLHDGTPFIQRAGDVLGKLAPMVACIRPYAPEAGGAVVSGGSLVSSYQLQKPHVAEEKLLDLPKRYDGPAGPNGTVRQHMLRAMPQVGIESMAAMPPGVMSSKLFTEISRKTYAFPRPPGLNAGQPWFQPQCGAGPEALDPSKDPEAR